MPWYFFALMATALYAITNFIEKYVLDKHVSDPMAVMTLSCFMNGVMGIIMILFFPQVRIANISQILWLLLSGALLVVYTLPYYKALLLEDTSLIIPLFQFIAVFLLILEALFLHEFLTIKQLIGVIVIIFSGLLLGNTNLRSILKPRKSFWLMMLSCFLVAFCMVIFKGVSANIGFWSSITYNFLGGGIFGILLLLMPNNRKKIKKVDYKTVGIILLIDDCVDMLARFFYFFGATLAMVTLVQLLGATQSFFVLFYGIILTLLFPKIIKEDIRWATIKNKLLVGAIMFAGMWLVYF